MEKKMFAALFDEFFSPDKAPAEKPEYLAMALEDFDKGKYQTIQQLDLENIPVYRGSPIDAKQHVLELARYYQGISYISTRKLNLAKTSLQWVAGHAEDRQLVLKARWNLALVYVKQKDAGQATVSLNEVIKTDRKGTYSKQAKLLLEKLK